MDAEYPHRHPMCRCYFWGVDWGAGIDRTFITIRANSDEQAIDALLRLAAEQGEPNGS